MATTASKKKAPVKTTPFIPPKTTNTTDSLPDEALKTEPIQAGPISRVVLKERFEYGDHLLRHFTFKAGQEVSDRQHIEQLIARGAPVEIIKEQGE